MTEWESYLAAHRERFLAELIGFLRIPSVSALPAHRPDIEAAARWVAGRLEAAGIEAVRILPTGAHPVVYGEWLHAPGKPTLLVYGHYDTQPADPLELWASPPFEPVVRDGRVYARGASDDKGNMLAPLLAAEAMLRTCGQLPVNLKFIFEGEEEIGSPHLPAFVAAHRDLLACDTVLNADGGQWDEGQPVLILETRGLAAVSLEVRGPGHDLHSGIYGGTVANPLHALARLLGSLHDEDGRVAVEGFYDRVIPLGEEKRAQFAEVPLDEAAYLRETGSPGLFGEKGYTTNERSWGRPALDVNGLWGGFQGEGVKTVLPARAGAKISCRLVADQDPAEVADLVVRHLLRSAPPGVEVTATREPAAADPYRMPPDHPGLRAAAAVLEELYGKPPYRIGVGGSIPANEIFLRHLGAYTVLFAFGLRDERQHSPNEFFRLSGFDLGQRAYGRLLERMGAD